MAYWRAMAHDSQIADRPEPRRSRPHAGEAITPMSGRSTSGGR
jgi:hypothetical protein